MVLCAVTMKLFLLFIACITLCRGSAIPQIPKDNSHYEEGVSRYIWMFREDGELVLEDLQGPPDGLSQKAGDRNAYWLYTRDNPYDYQLLIDGDENSISNSNYKADRPTFVLVHGWTNSGNSDCNRVQRDALLETLDCNVIVVDWRDDADQSYTVSVSRVPRVGEAVGRFLDWLLTISGGSWSDLHMTGYSLGAHVIGNAGRAVGGRPARLTGLDPAGPLWRLNNNRLQSSDGQYVEGIHTDGGLQGILSPVGDVDFYPNGGSNQPGCASSGCNHARSYQFFASSVPGRHLVGRQCNSLAQAVINNCSGPELLLGTADFDKQGSGIYGLRTQESWPF